MASTVLHGAAAALILAFGSSMALADDPSSATGANQHLDPEYQTDSDTQTLGATEMSEEDCLAQSDSDSADIEDQSTYAEGEIDSDLPATEHQAQVLDEEQQAAAAMEPAAGCRDVTGPDSLNPTQMQSDEDPSSETGANQ